MFCRQTSLQPRLVSDCNYTVGSMERYCYWNLSTQQIKQKTKYGQDSMGLLRYFIIYRLILFQQNINCLQKRMEKNKNEIFEKKRFYKNKDKTEYFDKKETKKKLLGNITNNIDELEIVDLLEFIVQKKQFEKQEFKAINKRLHAEHQLVENVRFQQLYANLGKLITETSEQLQAFKSIPMWELKDKGFKGFKFIEETTENQLKNHVSKDWFYPKMIHGKKEFYIWRIVNHKKTFDIEIDQPILLERLRADPNTARNNFIAFIEGLQSEKQNYEKQLEKHNEQKNN